MKRNSVSADKPLLMVLLIHTRTVAGNLVHCGIGHMLIDRCACINMCSNTQEAMIAHLSESVTA
jgi:hypothetical protein